MSRTVYTHKDLIKQYPALGAGKLNMNSSITKRNHFEHCTLTWKTKQKSRSEAVRIKWEQGNTQKKMSVPQDCINLGHNSNW